MILMILAGLTAAAWLIAVAIPSLLAGPVTRALDGLHRGIEGGRTRAARLVPAGLADLLVEVPVIALCALLLIAGTWGFFGILEDVVMGDPIIGLDATVFAWLKGLRTSTYDRILIALTGLGDHKTVIPVALAGLIVLAHYRRWRAAIYLAVATAGGAVFVAGVKGVIARPRPVSIYDGVAEYSFPSGHAAMSVVLFGFLGFLIAYGAPRLWRRATAFGCLLLIVLIAFSRVYLGAHWLSDVLAGLAFGVAWVALLALLYVRTKPEPLPAVPLAAVLIATLVVAGSVHLLRDGAKEASRYEVPASPGRAR